MSSTLRKRPGDARDRPANNKMHQRCPIRTCIGSLATLGWRFSRAASSAAASGQSGQILSLQPLPKSFTCVDQVWWIQAGLAPTESVDRWGNLRADHVGGFGCRSRAIRSGKRFIEPNLWFH